jgi:tRNA-splicing ligase RtcB (3'-phosphate/5'-hydroxy nucleic acid ligase)
MNDFALRATPLPYKTWGADQIDEQTHAQMRNAMRLPVAAAGALMPDAHVGYGLPIGGVLATENAVIPYAIGVDIACRMRITIYTVSSIVIGQRREQFRKALDSCTRFGMGGRWERNQQPEHAVLDDGAWQQTGLLRSLHTKAYEQIGSSGSGNHFVEWGSFALEDDHEGLGLKRGTYLALLSHSGSRGIGYQIATHYATIATQMHPELDEQSKHLAWLPMDRDIGREYWLSMELAGRYAEANHDVIHDKLTKALGLKMAVVIENHHNFAWRERIPAPKGSNLPERDVIVHRKGATPAAEGVYGIIPGSMADAGYVVEGLGNADALYSASHGAGRRMSRRQGLDSITKTERDRYLKARGVTLLSGGMDEAPQVYKPIDEVMAAQPDLVRVVGKFMPVFVKMATDNETSKEG